jgi:outer membrane receptor protein involved in Fe transport
MRVMRVSSTNIIFVATLISLFSVSPLRGQTTGSRMARGVVVDEKYQAIVAATVTARWADGSRSTTTDEHGYFSFPVGDEQVTLTVSGRFIGANRFTLVDSVAADDLQLRVRYEIPREVETLVITATATEPAIDRRNDAIYKNTLFLRDDQIFDTLDGGINAGQHEGGGKSIEVRRFGFNLDHGGAGGGLKVLVDDVPQNQATQGHGQGYLGALKSLSPELVEDVDMINGPFSVEYGDFSALGVVHIRLKERLDNALTLRAQGGSFNGYRTFAAWSPQSSTVKSFVAWEHAYTDGPFLSPLHYVRDNITANYSRSMGAGQSLGFKLNGGRNDFDSSGQIPLDLVYAGTLDRFGYMDPSDGGRVRSGTAGAYYKRNIGASDTLRVDGFVNRSLFDLFSNFTFYLNDPVNGDSFLQHDSRLQEGSSAQFLHAGKLLGRPAVLSSGGNVTDNWINVDLYHARDRKIIAPVPGNPWTETNVHILNPAGYTQYGVDFPHIHIDVGLRFDHFRFAVTDRATKANTIANAPGLEPKVNIAYRPLDRMPFALHFNYGRAVTSQDARGIVVDPTAPKVAATDFYMLGLSQQWKHFSMSTDAFLIDRQHENVYSADNGTMEYRGPSRAYGWELKASARIAAYLTWNAGLTQVGNAFFRGTQPREYVDSAPHSVGNASLTLSGWHGLFSSLRYRHVSRYLVVNPDDSTEPPAWPYASAHAAHAGGLDVLDFAATKKLKRGLEWNLSIDNLTNKRYYETQNFFYSRVTPTAPVEARIHGTPGYPIGFATGITWRFE